MGCTYAWERHRLGEKHKCEYLSESKQSLVEKLFPPGGQAIPNIRFINHTKPWQQQKLGEISEKVTEKNINTTFTETLTNSAEYGIVNQRDFFDKDISNKNNLCGYYIVRPDDFVYNPRISNLAPVGPIKRNNLQRTGVMSPLYYVFRVNHNINKTYLEQYFSTTKWHMYMKLNGDSGARSDRFAIKDNIFKQMSIPIPNNPIEQEKIGSFFSKLDSLVDLQQRKCQTLKLAKHSLLNYLFPSNGHTSPNIRFTNHTKPWQQQKLGEVAEIRRGLTYKPEDVKASGIRVLRSSNINEEYFESYKDDVFVDELAVNIPCVKNGDIIITSANGSSRLVGKHAIIKSIPDNSMVHGGFMLVASTNEPEFLNSSMSSP